MKYELWQLPEWNHKWNVWEDDITLKDIQNIVSVILWWRNNNTVVLTTWSSWRWEEYAAIDDLELLIFWDNKCLLAEEILNMIWVTKRKCSLLIERKTFDNVAFFEWLECSPIQSPVFFPSRFIDYWVIYWDDSKLIPLESNFIHSLHEIGRKDLDRWNERIRYHKKVSQTWEWSWKWGTFKIFDQNERILIYEKWDNKEVSIKIWPLRYIQYLIVKIIIQLVKLWDVKEKNFRDIWKSISDKLDFLSERKIELRYLEVEELKSLYNFFLNIHNKMSKNFKRNQDWSISFSDEDFKIFTEQLSRFNTLLWKLRLNDINPLTNIQR